MQRKTCTEGRCEDIRRTSSPGQGPGDLPGGPVLETSPSSAKSTDSTPVWRAQIPHALVKKKSKENLLGVRYWTDAPPQAPGGTNQPLILDFQPPGL